MKLTPAITVATLSLVLAFYTSCGTFSDEQIAAVLTYCRNSFGNAAPAVTPEQVAAARTKFASVNAPAGVKRAEIDKILHAKEADLMAV